MTLVPKREYMILLLGDIAVFAASLWITLALRYFALPSKELYIVHLVPFSFLFLAWIAVFFLAGLYSRHSRLFRSRLSSTIFYTQIINMAVAALFFFLIPAFGLAPKTILVLYLISSFALILFWRTGIFPHIPRTRKLNGVLIASGPDADALLNEIKNDPQSSFVFDYAINTKTVPTHEIIEEACRIAEDDDVMFLVVDLSDKAISSALPIIYGAAFQKRRFALIDIADLYEEIFDRVPLSFVTYEWVLVAASSSHVYDVLKRATDVIGSIIIGILSIPIYPFVYLAIKMDDGGDIFITQKRVGKFQSPIEIIKFRSMSGNDEGIYDSGGKTKLQVTRVGKWLRLLRIDEFPQLWNVLKGELSLVGPRPELPAIAKEYSAKIPYYNARCLIPPGLMGWAQLRHDKHPHHGADVAETKAKLSYDMYYLKKRSFLLDLYIILQTVRIMLLARGT